jgi:coenzyme F420 hydrogenase subunit beta
MKHYPIREKMNSIVEPLRKTWFWELGEAVIDADRCVGCGVCVAVCPSNSIGISATGVPELVKMCTGCSLCWDFCPRAGLRFEATWHDEEAAPPASDAELPLGGVDGSGDADGWSIVPAPSGDGLGAVVQAVAVRARHAAAGAQDGGAVTTILTALLEAGDLDGALVSKPSSDPAEPWKVVATIATTPAELAAAAGSFYNQTMALASLDLHGTDLPEHPRIALVGTPCEVQGLRAMQLRPWDTGAHRVDAVALTVALFCTKSFNYEALVVDELARRRGVDLSRVAKLDVTRGRFLVDDVDGVRVVDEPVKSFLGAALKGCRECADFVGRAADLSVGSVGSADGWTTVLIRTERGLAAFEQAREHFEVVDDVDFDAVLRLDALNKQIAVGSLTRELDPAAPMFIEYGAHVRATEESQRVAVTIAR